MRLKESNALVEMILWKQCIARRCTTMKMLRDTPFEYLKYGTYGDGLKVHEW